MDLDNEQIVLELLDYEKTGNMSIEAFIAINTMNTEQKKEVFQLRDFARFINEPPESLL